jgi:hypothetical protein
MMTLNLTRPEVVFGLTKVSGLIPQAIFLPFGFLRKQPS